MIRLFDLWAGGAESWATLVYTVLYHLGWIIHAAFVGYVAGGTIWVAVAEWRRHPDPAQGPGAPLNVSIEPRAILIDWLPAMLSGAITAGVVPLLFVQILYPKDFYTANLLLFHRWMSILPVLIIGFYALYLLRSGTERFAGFIPRRFVALVPMLAVLYTGYSFVENHLLSLREQQLWIDLYAQHQTVYFEPLLPVRALYFLAALSSLLFIGLGWQLEYRARRGRTPLGELPSVVAGLALIASATAAIAGIIFLLMVRSRLGEGRESYVLLLLVALILLVACWTKIRALGDRFSRPALVAGSSGCALLLVVTSLLREDLRAAALGAARLSAHSPVHLAALQKGGFPLFVVFALLNTALIAGCFMLVRRSATRRY